MNFILLKENKITAMKLTIKILLLSFLIQFNFLKISSQQFEDEIKDIENGLLPSVLFKNENRTKYNIHERMEHYHVPGVSIAVVKDGELRWAKGYGIANSKTETKVDENTLFQAGSISKPVGALAILKMVQEGKVDLDEDVNNYLKKWKIPDSKFLENQKVTIRRLLTHSAGMTVHGFPGYSQKDKFPTIENVLKGKGNTPAIYVDTIPGSIFRYSGGGYTVMEYIVETISGMPFEKYLHENILSKIEMTNSTYEQPLPESLHSLASAAYDHEGKIIKGLWNNYPEQAAAGLWTTPSDLAKYCIEIQEIASGKSNGILKKSTIEQMLTKHKNDWGLGPSLMWGGDSLLFQHGGKNAGFTNNMAAFAHKGDAVIVMTNADNGSKLMDEIFRSISAYYNLGISNPKIVEPLELSNEELSRFTGKFKQLDFPKGWDEFVVEMKIENKGLISINPNNNDTLYLVPFNEMKFVDIKNGWEFEYIEDEEVNQITFIFNSRTKFIKFH